jgi:hypothetical protein
MEPLLPTAGPGAQKNFDREHLPRDGGTPRAESLRSLCIPRLIQFVKNLEGGATIP